MTKKNTSIRYERKWVLKNLTLDQIKIILFKSNFFFKKQYEDRNINSIYFDDFYLNSINENLDGISQRKKYRLRWYGNKNIIDRANLEIKHKKNFLNYKDIIPLKSIKILKINEKNISYINRELKEKLLNLKVIEKKNLEAKSQISYKRKYFISAQNNIRATIDFNIQSRVFNNSFREFYYKYDDIILELKYDKNLDEYVKKFTSSLQSRFTKSSKYVNYTLNISRNISYEN